MIRYKMNILSALKDHGYSSYRLRKDKVLGQATIQQLRNDEIVSMSTINQLCAMLHSQPGDLLEFIPDPEEEG